MHLLLFIIYLALLGYLLQRIRLFRDCGIRPVFLQALFALRVGAGCLHNLIAWRYYPNHGDIWAFYYDSFITRQELFHDFHRFIQDNITWAYLPYNITICLHVLFNFLSFDNLYINTLFFSFGVFAGSVALFRACRVFFRNDMICAACTLLLPSTIYWTACVNKDGLIYLSLGFFFYALEKTLYRRRHWRSILACGVFFALICFFRASVALSLLPGLAVWVFREGKGKQAQVAKWCIGVGLATLILMCLTKPERFKEALTYVSTQQSAYRALSGHSRIYLPVLSPDINSFVRTLPVALLNGGFQPLPGEGGRPVYLLFSIESMAIWLIVLYAILIRLRSGFPSGSGAAPQDRLPSGFWGPTLCCLIFFLAGMLLIGYTIPFAGAIVRYRSLYLPFLLMPFIHVIRINRNKYKMH